MRLVGWQPTSIVVAIPTIAARGTLAEECAVVWQHHTCQPVRTIISSRPGSWAAGLNDAWEQVRDDPPTVFVCASDDMAPADSFWLPPLLAQLARGYYPAPTVVDPRFTNYGGHLQPVPDGTRSEMSTLPVLRGDWLQHVFPLPADLHYFSDNLIAVLLRKQRIGCVAVPSSRIRHLHAREGRGAGHGSEQERMFVDTVRYSDHLASVGVDRDTLPEKLRGGLWEERHLDHGRALTGRAGR